MANTTELEKLQLEEKRLEIEERKEALRLRRLESERLERDAKQYELKDADRQTELRNRASALESQRPENKYRVVRSICNHQQGGKGRQALTDCKGDGKGAIIKYRLCTGDILLKCPRCRGTWVPPFQDEFYFDKSGNPVARDKGGEFDKAAFKAAVDEYSRIFNIPSDNYMIEQPQFNWLRNGQNVTKEKTRIYTQGLGAKSAQDYWKEVNAA